MSRSFKLTHSDCASIINERARGDSIEKLMKDYGVSRATVYRVLSGEYSNRMGMPVPRPSKHLFKMQVVKGLNKTMADVLKSPEVDLDIPLDTMDPTTRAAMELVVARGKFNKSLHT